MAAIPGMTPADFAAFVRSLAERGRPRSGRAHPRRRPYGTEPMAASRRRSRPWTKAEAMVAAYAGAGFSKIHLDASMGCAGEPEALDDMETAARAVRLARAAEAARRGGRAGAAHLCRRDRGSAAGRRPPRPRLGRADLPASRAATRSTPSEEPSRQQASTMPSSASSALVVQPGVEFGHDSVVAYRAGAGARALEPALASVPGLVFEAHSTDYQPPRRLAALVRDGFAILKVGPGLTFAMREALYGLDLIASELDPAYPGRALADAMEAVMVSEPGFWEPYYPGQSRDQHVLRHYSYSDRIRYYWPAHEARLAVGRLFAALEGVVIPPTLVSQFLRGVAAGRTSVPEPRPSSPPPSMASSPTTLPPAANCPEGSGSRRVAIDRVRDPCRARRPGRSAAGGGSARRRAPAATRAPQGQAGRPCPAAAGPRAGINGSRRRPPSPARQPCWSGQPAAHARCLEPAANVPAKPRRPSPARQPSLERVSWRQRSPAALEVSAAPAPRPASILERLSWTYHAALEGRCSLQPRPGTQAGAAQLRPRPLSRA